MKCHKDLFRFICSFFSFIELGPGYAFSLQNFSLYLQFLEKCIMCFLSILKYYYNKNSITFLFAFILFWLYWNNLQQLLMFLFFSFYLFWRIFFNFVSFAWNTIINSYHSICFFPMTFFS